ncbi:MAG: S-layer homology domain-containing protein [Acidimicrobiia bacterium]|nr:S-layer homology domain-containing protein [Acidimicrobiia bacterium]
MPAHPQYRCHAQNTTAQVTSGGVFGSSGGGFGSVCWFCVVKVQIRLENSARRREPEYVTGERTQVRLLTAIKRATANASRNLIIVMSVSLVVGLLTAASASAEGGFTDVEPDSYYSDAVDWSLDNNITGIVGDRFEPERRITRGEAALWLWRMNGRPSAAPHNFTDVNAQYTEAVAWMFEAGITTGTSATKFSPGGGLTRAEIAAFLWRMAGKPNAPASSFSDVDAHWQQGPVAWLANTGITTGTSPTTFSPAQRLKRAQLITFLYRYDKRYAISATVTDGDAEGAETTETTETAETTEADTSTTDEELQVTSTTAPPPTPPPPPPRPPPRPRRPLRRHLRRPKRRLHHPRHRLNQCGF